MLHEGTLRHRAAEKFINMIRDVSCQFVDRHWCNSRYDPLHYTKQHETLEESRRSMHLTVLPSRLLSQTLIAISRAGIHTLFADEPGRELSQALPLLPATARILPLAQLEQHWKADPGVISLKD